jgi:hypothetical protein
MLAFKSLPLRLLSLSIPAPSRHKGRFSSRRFRWRDRQTLTGAFIPFQRSIIQPYSLVQAFAA